MQSEPEAILEVVELCKTYGGVEPSLGVLRRISLRIEPGDVYGIIGLSGAGKSTLIRCFAGLTKPSSGQILFHGEDLSRMKGEQIQSFHRKTGMIFQHFNLFSSRTAAGNISYPLEIAGMPKEKRETRVEELLKLVGLSEKKNAYPTELSGGEKQRVGIARALANHPELLFCDEATSALDPKTTQEILSLLKKINQKLNVTIVVITHEMEVVKRICNKVAVLEMGQIVEKGPIVQIFSDPRHPTTQHLIERGPHELPIEFFKPPSPNRKLLKLRFKGTVAGEPIISQIARSCHVEANILLGWIDRLQTVSIGILIIELMGEADGIQRAIRYLEDKSIGCEELEHGI